MIALDGTWYFSSDKVHCEDCSHIEHKSGQITYYHRAITHAATHRIFGGGRRLAEAPSESP